MDKGYSSAAVTESCAALGITPYIPVKKAVTKPERLPAKPDLPPVESGEPQDDSQAAAAGRGDELSAGENRPCGPGPELPATVSVGDELSAGKCGSASEKPSGATSLAAERELSAATSLAAGEKLSAATNDAAGDVLSAFEACRERAKTPVAKQIQRRRSEVVERTFAHVCETGGARRTHLRGLEKVRKRYMTVVAARNLSVILRKVWGFGKPRTLQGRKGFGRGLSAAFGAFFAVLTSLMRHLLPWFRPQPA